jgi:hypothetical protein
MNRILNYGSGEISATWTFSTSTALATTDRGTGYAHFDGTTWVDNPTQRIESKRVGWPNVVVLGDDKEIVATHNTDANVEDLQFTYRANSGTGTWTEDILTLQSPSPDGNWWPRMASGGVDENSLHVISITYPVANQGTLYHGQDGALLYSRSTDGGTTWDIEHQVLADIDSSHYLGFSADDYAFSNAVGDTIAFVAGGVFKDLVLMKSTDNGSTWNKTVIDTFPYPFFDYDVTQIDSATFSNDGSLSVVLDANGKAHVFFGGVYVVNDDITDGAAYNYYPGTSALYHWDEDFGTSYPDSIAGWIDFNNDGIVSLDSAIAYDSLSGYNTSVVSFPSAGIDADGNLYLAYSSVVENLTIDEDRPFRHIYLTKSTDGGQTWSPSVDLNYTEDDDFTESIFASMAYNVDDYLHILYQRDLEGGNWFSGNHDAATNDIVYVKVSTALDVSVKEEHSLFDEFTVYPNPAGTSTKVSFTVNTAGNVVVNVYDITGQLISSYSNKVPAGRNSLDINVENFASGVYFINAQIGADVKTQKLMVK